MGVNISAQMGLQWPARQDTGRGTGAGQEHKGPIITKRRAFPFYVGGGSTSRYGESNVESEVSISGTVLDTPYPIVVGHALVTGQLINTPAESTPGIYHLAYRLFDADNRVEYEISNVKVGDYSITATGGSTGVAWIPWAQAYDGTQTARDATFGAAFNDWDQAFTSMGVLFLKINANTGPGFQIPTVTCEVKTSTLVDWASQDDVTGLDDITVTGIYTAADNNRRWQVKIDSVGTPDQFVYRSHDGSSWSSWSAAANVSVSPTTLNNGIKVQWAATTGHTVDDVWTIRQLSNPFMAKYFFLTSLLFGPGWDDSMFDVSSWTDKADRCDEAMADDTSLWSTNGQLEGDKAADVINLVRKHCFGWLTTFGGTYYAGFDHELSSADGTFIQDDGDFTDDGYPQVTWIDNGVTYDSGSTTYKDTANNWVEAGATYAPSTQNQKLEERTPLFINASVATRWIEQRILKDLEERRLVSFTSPPENAINLMPGDRADVTDNTGLSSFAVRVETAKKNQSETWTITGREYKASALSTSTDTEKSTVDGGTSTAPPAPPTSPIQTFIEAGPWETDSYVPDPDDYTSGWTTSNMVFAYNASRDASAAGSTGTSASGYGYYDFTSALGSEDSLLVHILSNFYGSLYPQQGTWYIEYETNSGVQASFELAGEDDKYNRTVFVVPVDSSGTYHRIKIRYSNPWAGVSNIGSFFRRLHVVPYRRNSGMMLAEKWEWTEAATPEDTVSRYSFGFVNQNGAFTESASTPVNTSEINVTQFNSGLFHANADYYEGLYFTTMKVVGIYGAIADFTGTSIRTQNFEESQPGVLVTTAAGLVGIGESDPDEFLHIYDNPSPAAAATMIKMENNGSVQQSFIDNNASVEWVVQNANNGLFSITKAGTGVREFQVDGSGNVEIQGAHVLNELASTPPAPDVSAQCNVYMKSDKFVIMYDDAGTTKYWYLDLTSTSGTWTYTTTAP